MHNRLDPLGLGVDGRPEPAESPHPRHEPGLVKHNSRCDSCGVLSGHLSRAYRLSFQKGRITITANVVLCAEHARQMREYIRHPKVNEPPRLKKLRNYRVRQEPPE